MTPGLHLYFSLLSFLFGACVGSFLNVCIHRIPREESVVRPRSHCPRCGQLIAWYDNVPLLSWIVLRARCRHCGGRIAGRYAAVELLTAVIFWEIWRRYGAAAPALVPAYWIFSGGLILGTFVDFEHMIIPDRVTWGGMITGLVLSAALPSLHSAADAWAGLRAAAIGAAVGFGSLWLVARIGRWVFKQDAMGFGDVKLLGAIGAFLGWPAVLFTIVVSSFAGSLVGLFLVLRGNKGLQSRIPYGPYLALAALLWIVGGRELWWGYVAWVVRVN